MAFDGELAARALQILANEADVTEKRMFGGIGFLLRGNMIGGVLGNALIVRVGPPSYAEALGRPHVRPFDVTGREMRGWVMVTPAGTGTDAELRGWLRQGLAFAATLEAKW